VLLMPDLPAQNILFRDLADGPTAATPTRNMVTLIHRAWIVCGDEVPLRATEEPGAGKPLCRAPLVLPCPALKAEDTSQMDHITQR